MNSSSTKIILKKLKEMNTIWHPDSTLVFKSKEQQVVIGRWDNSVFVDLDEIALELCDTWKFKVDESLIEQEVEEEVVDAMIEDVQCDAVANKDVEEVVDVKEDEVVIANSIDIRGNVIKSITSILDEPFTKIEELTKALEYTQDNLRLQKVEYEKLLLDYQTIQSKFTTLKSLLG